MKLSELRHRFSKKYVIRIVAGVLVVALAGTNATAVKAVPVSGGCAAGNAGAGNFWKASPVSGVGAAGRIAAAENIAETEDERADDDVTEDSGAQADQTETLLDTAIGGHISDKEKEVGKEETVYVITDSTGKEKEVIVSSHLINSDGKDTIKDTSTLKEIENVKGDETYTREGDGLDWKAAGNDIFYRGTSDGPVPVSQKITYYLDGKEITAEELAGKSGKVKIRFSYENNQKVTADVGGKQTEVCVPFVVISGLVLDEKFSNIKAENGKVMADGNNSMVLGYTMPGLKESLDVRESDFDGEVRFPDYFEVTADVEAFSLGTTMTVVMNAADFVSREGDGDSSTLDEAFDTLTDAANQLEDGSAELKDGTGTLKSKMGEFADGVGALASGIKDYTDGASTLAEGIGTLQGGVQSLTDNVPALTSGVGQLKEGSASAAQGAAALKEGTGSLKAGAGELSKGATELSAGANNLSTGAGTLLAGANDLSAGAGTLSAGANDLYAGAGTLSTGANDLYAGAGTLSAGANDLYAGAGTLSTGANDLSAGAGSLSEGVSALAQGTRDALAGANALSAGASSLNDGVGTLVGKIQGMGGQLEQTKNGLFAQAGVSTYEELEGALGQLRAGRDQCLTALTEAAAAGATDQAGAAAAQLAEINGKIEAVQSAMGAITVIGQVQQELSAPEVAAQLGALQTGAGDLATGAANLAAGLGTLSQGADSAAAGAADVAAGAGNLAAGAGSLVTGAGNLAAGAGDLVTGAGNLAAGAGDLVTGAGSLAAGAGDLATGAGNLVAGAGELATGAGDLAAGAGKVSSGAKQVSEGSAQVDDGAASLASGLGTLDAGLGTLNEKAGMLGGGAAALKDGTDRLAAGVAQLVANNGKLNDGAHQIADGTAALSDGIGALDDGAQRLADGIVEFNEEGIEKILDTFNGDIEPLLDRMQAVLDAGNAYQSYAGLADGVNGSVKFIYKTEAVKADQGMD